MSGGMEMDPEAIQAFAAVLADAKAQFDVVKAEVETPAAVAEDFGRSWQDQGALFVTSWGELGPEMASLSALLEQVQAQLGQSAELTVANETANVGKFNTINEGDTSGAATEESSAPSGASIGGFALSNAGKAFNDELFDGKAISESCADVILGTKLNRAVRDLANEYIKRLDLDREFRATDERARLLDLNWGKIEHDAGLLKGLGAAIADLSVTLSSGAAKLGESWKGDSYEAFKAALGKISTTLTAYANGATETGTQLTVAMTEIRAVYEEYAQGTVHEHLNFGDVSLPEDWHKVSSKPEDEYSPVKLAEACTFDPGWFCTKREASQGLVSTFVTEFQWGTCKVEPCTKWPGEMQAKFDDVKQECHDAIEGIKGNLSDFYKATNEAVNSVTEMMDVAVGNLYELTEGGELSLLRIVGGAGGGTAPADAGDYSGGGGYPGGGSPGGGGGYPGGSGGPVGAAEPMPVAAPPPVEVPEIPEVAPAAVEPPVDEPADAATPESQETVRIEDGDRAISVSSPDGSGQVRVTVEDATGATKSYSLDFDAASGLLPMGQDPAVAAEPAIGPDGQPVEDEVQQIPASTNGKCVIEDGPLTITAERPLFAPDSLRLVVDDGTGEPTTYTVDFAEQTDDPTGTDTGRPAVAPGPTLAADQEITPPSAEPVAEGGTAEEVTAEPDVLAEEEPPVETAAAEASAAEAPAAEALAAESPAEAVAPAQSAAPPVDADQATAPQSEGDGTGAMSGRLPEPGTAELGVAADDNGAAPAGGAAGMPMLGGAGAQGDSGDSGGRISSGWSVHGDLFDSGEPVYSMHGVLGDDDRDAEQVSR